jgi:hypothetical protein
MNTSNTFTSMKPEMKDTYALTAYLKNNYVRLRKYFYVYET